MENKITDKNTPENGAACGQSKAACYTHFCDYELNPLTPTAEEAKEMSTPKGMRRRIELYQMHCPLTRRCFDIAKINKCDELDTMTILAFQALTENQRLKEQMIKQAHL